MPAAKIQAFRQVFPPVFPKQILQHQETEIKMTLWICFGPEAVDMSNELGFQNSLTPLDPRFY